MKRDLMNSIKAAAYRAGPAIDGVEGRYFTRRQWQAILDSDAHLRAENRKLWAMCCELTVSHHRTCICVSCLKLKQNGYAPKPKRKR